MLLFVLAPVTDVVLFSGNQVITIEEAVQEIKKCANKVLAIRPLALSLDFCQVIITL